MFNETLKEEIKLGKFLFIGALVLSAVCNIVMYFLLFSVLILKKQPEADWTLIILLSPISFVVMIWAARELYLSQKKLIANFEEEQNTSRFLVGNKIMLDDH